MNIPEDKILSVTFHTCVGCGYTTHHITHAKTHNKIVRECANVGFVTKVRKIVILEDLMNANVETHSTAKCELRTPNDDVKTTMMKALGNPELLSELRSASVQEIPALVFKYAKGAGSGHAFFKIEGDKVVEKDVNGNEKKMSKNKYVKKVIGDVIYTVENHADQIRQRDEYTPYEKTFVRQAKQSVDEFLSLKIDGHKRNEQTRAIDVLNNYSVGDQVVYKYPSGTKKLIEETVNNLENQLHAYRQNEI